MYFRVVLVCLIVTVFISSCDCQDDGIRISLGDRTIPNHGLVNTEDIGVDRTGTYLTGGLKCSTTYEQCCNGSGRYSFASTAKWHHGHSETHVQSSDPSIPFSEIFAFGMSWHGQAVYLFRNSVLDYPTRTDGIWRCTIPDRNGEEKTKYIGIYTVNGTAGSLSVGSPSTLLFSIIRDDPVVFSLIFRTTGGPVTHITWTRDGVNISSLGDNHYTPAQIVLSNIYTDSNLNNRTVYTAGNYTNILTVRGRLPGVYGVSVTNDRTTTPVTPGTVTIIDFAHSNIFLSVTRSQDLTRIVLSWTLVNPSFMKHFRSYEVKYTLCHMWSGNCETNERLETINEFATTTYTVTDVALWATYKFKVSATFILPTINDSTHILPTPISTGYRTITTLGVLAPEITSVTELANVTSVRVTWNQPEGGLDVDEYVVSYRRLNERDGQCSSLQDESSVIVSVSDQSVILHLKALYSTYTVSVTATKSDFHNSSSQNFKTKSTVPSGAPQNINIVSSTATTVTISWDGVECIHRNGLITHYIISYESETSEITTVRVNSNGEHAGGSYTVSGLKPATMLTMTVAAVNDAGVGIGAIIHWKTIGNYPRPFQIKLERTDDCSFNWNAEKAEEIRTNIHTKLFQVIQKQCQCKMPKENLFNGAFSCLRSQNQTTYRSSIIGTQSHNATELVGFIQDWVNSAPTMIIQWYTVKVDPDCPVGIASLDDPECEPTTCTSDP